MITSLPLIRIATGIGWKQPSPKRVGISADHAIIEKEFNATLELCLSKLPAKLLPFSCARVLDEDDSENICKEFNLSASNYWVILAIVPNS